MKINKNINLVKTYKILENFITDNSQPYEDRLTIYRFLNKLTDTEDFELRVNREFSAYKLKNKKDEIEMNINKRVEINLSCGFSLVPYRADSWKLYLDDELFLESLDARIAKRIAYDINVAFSIKHSQLFRKQ